jgi:hypothetical protein
MTRSPDRAIRPTEGLQSPFARFRVFRGSNPQVNPMPEIRRVTFTCRATLRQPPEDIAAQILDLAKWPEFTGYAFLPGIRKAEFEARTPEVVGTRIRVTNTDGSSHVEEIVEWSPDRRVQLRFGDFSPPLSRLAAGFDETWLFRREGEVTEVVREFALWPKTWWARVALWGIAKFLKRAVARHMRQLINADAIAHRIETGRLD